MSESSSKGDEQAPKTTVEQAGAKGGKMRAARMTPEQRREASRQAADARWAVPQATHTGEIELSGHRVPCAVLDNGLRVLTQEGFLRAIGRTGKPTKESSNSLELPPWLDAENLKPFISNELRAAFKPFSFRTPATGTGRGQTGRRAGGYDANLLPMVCEVYLKAKAQGATTAKQEHVVQACTLLMCGFARVGLAAMIDEATGYQEVRDRRALQAILDLYLRQELAAWAKRFPDEFYREMFRLKGWTWNCANPSFGPRCIAAYTDDVVYRRIAPELLEELRRRNPVQDSGRRAGKHHQLLTDEVGHPALAQRLHGLVGLMRAAHDWDEFMRMLDRAWPRCGHSVQLDFNDVGDFAPRLPDHT
jgi:hypothetical protein